MIETGLPTWQRIALGVVGGFLIVGYYAFRWRRASQQAEAMQRESAETKAWHEQLLHHPAWAQLQAYLVTQGIHVQPGHYRVMRLSIVDARSWPRAPGDPAGVALTAYLLGPKKLCAGMMLATGAPSLHELGFFTWPPDLPRS